MKNKETASSTKDVKTNLKHDTMEFSAATDGDDKLDTDDAAFEEDEITIDELDALEDDDIDDKAYALNTVETDTKADDTIMPEEDWTDDLPDVDKNDGEEKMLPRA